MQKILVSACLLGSPVRYDGKSKPIDDALLSQWQAEGRLVSVCPEVEGGLDVPRSPAEQRRVEGELRVVSDEGEDVTECFITGAQRALALCTEHAIDVAILTEASPSCGSTEVYDGSFSRHKIAGEGVTTALLRRHGVTVFNQHQLVEVAAHLQRLEKT